MLILNFLTLAGVLIKQPYKSKLHLVKYTVIELSNSFLLVNLFPFSDLETLKTYE